MEAFTDCERLVWSYPGGIFHQDFGPRTIGQEMKFAKKPSRLRVPLHFCNIKIAGAQEWLPSDLVRIQGVILFKQTLDRKWNAMFPEIRR